MLSVNMLTSFGALAAILTCVGYLPYLIDTLLGKTAPQRASWLIWSVLSLIVLATQIAEGAKGALAFVTLQSAGTVLIFGLSVFVGRERYLNPRDYMALGAAAIGLGLWYAVGESAYALAIVVGISFSGGILTIRKAFQRPASETLATWILFFLSALSATLAVGSSDPVLLAYPIYLAALYLSIALAMVFGRVRLSKKVAPSGLL